MKKISKKILSMGSAIILLTSMSVVSASAEVSGHYSASNMSFSKSWSKNIVFNLKQDGQVAEASAKIGFDTRFVNEDYIDRVYAPHGWEHRGRVENGACQNKYTAWTSGGFASNEAEVNHTNRYVDFWVYVKISQ